MSGTINTSIENRIAAALQATKYEPVPKHIKGEMPPDAQVLGKISPASAALYCLLAELKAELDKLKKAFPVDGAATEANITDGRLVAEKLTDSIANDFNLSQANVALYGEWQAALLVPAAARRLIFLGSADAKTLAALVNGRLRQ